MPDLTEYADSRGLIRAALVLDHGHRRSLQREVAKGCLVRLSRGAYLPTSVWAELDADARYRATVHATATGRLAPDELLCGQSAAALWRLPSLAPWPTSVHSVRPSRGSGRRNGLLIRHVSAQRDEGVVIDGLRCTTLARTVGDVAAASTFASGLAMVDAALRGHTGSQWSRPPLDPSALLDNIHARPVAAGRSRALRIAAVGDARAASAGESLLRATVYRMGLPAPELQVEFMGDSGRTYFVDLYWPDQDFVLEFDGKVKYTDSRLRAGRTAEEIVYEEKRREDEIRAQVRGMTRVDWEIGGSPAKLERRLRAAGFIFP